MQNLPEGRNPDLTRYGTVPPEPPRDHSQGKGVEPTRKVTLHRILSPARLPAFATRAL